MKRGDVVYFSTNRKSRKEAVYVDSYNFNDAVKIMIGDSEHLVTKNQLFSIQEWQTIKNNEWRNKYANLIDAWNARLADKESKKSIASIAKELRYLWCNPYSVIKKAKQLGFINDTQQS